MQDQKSYGFRTPALVLLVVLLMLGADCTAFILPDRISSIGIKDRIWALVPYALLLCVMPFARQSRRGGWVVLSGTLLVVGLGLAVTVESFGRMNSTSSLILLFLPLWQCAGALLTLGVAFGLSRRVSPP